MSFVYELITWQNKDTFLHKKNMFIPKIIYMIFVILTILLREVYLEIIIIIVNILMMTLILRALKTVATITFIWAMFFATISSIDFLLETYDINVLFNLLYSFSTMSCGALFYLSTPPSHLRDFLGTNILTLSYSLIRSFLTDLLETLDSYKARGLETRFNVLRYIGFLYTSINIVMTRSELLEDSLKARGFEAD